MSYSEILAKRILELCKERNWSINELAGFSGLPQTTVNNIVINRYKSPKMLTVHLIATGFGMSMSEFLDFPEFQSLEYDDLQGMRNLSEKK